MKNLLPAAILSASATTLAQAAVSVDNIQLSPYNYDGANYLLTVFQDAPATDATGMWFSHSGPQLSFVNSLVDEGSDWYAVSAGDTFSASTISNGDFLTFFKSDSAGFHSNPVTIALGSFFLGVNTGRGFTSEGPARQFFGWVELSNNGSSLTLLSSAMTYDSPGIVVGSLTTIPEPSTCVLWLSGIAACFCVARRRAHDPRA